jgi:hypothetical protein
MEYAIETKWLGEYVAEARNSMPSKNASFRTERICFGIKTVCVRVKRSTARREIDDRRPT